MTHPFKSRARTGQEIADSRYEQKSAAMPSDPLGRAAEKNTRETDGPEEVFVAAPGKQVSNKRG